MTNTNLMRCGRGPFSLLWVTAPGSSDLLREPVHEPDELGLLVAVESPLGGTGLRGARRGASGRPGGEPPSCAWGRLPPCGVPPPVRFRTGGLRLRATGASAVRTANRLWFASVAGEFRWAQSPVPGCTCAGRTEREGPA
ncbi:hypothetical protein [Kitasatospora phosalacinea]|uniref:Uncharacterized protein n=1 Tax=Kitasatospora phosalacinea TaxID=2065 RepID=A0ABW6GMM8_9ACTN